MELQEALAQIGEIRSRMARTETFRGYRSATVGFTSLLAFAAAATQHYWAPDPQADPRQYLALWLSVAAISVTVVGAELTVSCLRTSSTLARHGTRLAVEQFLPCVLAGGALTWAVVRFNPENCWMLPGLWGVIFSLGIFASWRLLPRAAFAVAAYYLAAGIACLALARGEAAFTPWAMAGTFGAGQLLTAAVLYFALERPHGTP